MRRFVLAIVVLWAVAGCAGGGPPAEIEDDGLDLSELNSAVAEVAARQADADPLLAEHLAAIREFDAIIEELRDPEQVDAAKERWPAVADDLQVIDVESLRGAYREVATAVDEARVVLGDAREEVQGEWEADYLGAQDRVLQAVRDHARAADALAQVIGEHRDLYRTLQEVTGTFVEQRWFYRSSQEAADAYELELKPHLDDLRDARVLIARFAAARDEAAVAVNEATADAAAVWGVRPSDPSAGVGR